MELSGLVGQSGKFRRRLEKRWQRLYRVAYSWCHDAQLACDLVQETMVRALHKRRQLRDERALDSWLFSILANCWRDHCRRNRETVAIDDVVLVNEHSPEDEQDQHEVVIRVRAAVARLNPDQRQVVTLVDLGGFAYGEVAEVLGIPAGTVMSRLCRARRALREYLQDMEAAGIGKKPGLRRVK